MTTTQEIQPGRRIDLTREVVGLDRADGRARLVDQVAGRPPQRIDGFTIGAPQIAGDPPHDGEMHPDGDELLYLVSGAVTVTLELSGGNTQVDLGAGDALVVPQGRVAPDHDAGAGPARPHHARTERRRPPPSDRRQP